MKIYNHKIKEDKDSIYVVITASPATTYKALQSYATKQVKKHTNENIFSYGREGEKDKKLNEDTYEFTYLFKRN